MKKTILFLFICFVKTLSGQDLVPRITFDIRDSGPITCRYFPLSDREDWIDAECHPTPEGYIIALPDTEDPVICKITFELFPELINHMVFPLMPGEKVTIDGRVEDAFVTYAISGSPLLEEYSRHRKELEPLDKELNSYLIDSELSEKFIDRVLALFDEKENREKAYIMDHPSSPLSAWYAASSFWADGKIYREMLDVPQEYEALLVISEWMYAEDDPEDWEERWDPIGDLADALGLNDDSNECVVLYFWDMDYENNYRDHFTEFNRLLLKYGDQVEFAIIHPPADEEFWQRIVSESLDPRGIHYMDRSGAGEQLLEVMGIRLPVSEMILLIVDWQDGSIEISDYDSFESMIEPYLED